VDTVTRPPQQLSAPLYPDSTWFYASEDSLSVQSPIGRDSFSPTSKRHFCPHSSTPAATIRGVPSPHTSISQGVRFFFDGYASFGIPALESWGFSETGDSWRIAISFSIISSGPRPMIGKGYLFQTDFSFSLSRSLKDDFTLWSVASKEAFAPSRWLMISSPLSGGKTRVLPAIAFFYPGVVIRICLLF